MSDDTTEESALNVFGEPLEPCGRDPDTGFYRDGHCRTGFRDRGNHVICAEMTEEFLAFTEARGNDLTTPRPDWNFPGLEPGDRWCVCAARWKEALEAHKAPPVVLAATERSATEIVPLELLEPFAVDLPEKAYN
ncbi:MAG: DUF2237 family protein [Bradymonadaceae bacterium]